MKEVWIIYARNQDHQCTHYWHKDAEHRSAEIVFLKFVEQVGYDQNKNGEQDHFCQVRPVPIVAKQQVG